MHSRLVHGKACDRRCPFMHSKREKTPRCLESRDITFFKVCFNFIAVLPLTISNNHLCIILLAMPIRLPFDNGNIMVRSLVHILVHVLDGKYGRTYLHVDVRVVFGCQVKIIRDNRPVIHHALRLWIYKNAGLTAPVLRVPVNIKARFFTKRTWVRFLALSLLHALCVEKIWTTWPMHHARSDRLVRLRMVYRIQNLS